MKEIAPYIVLYIGVAVLFSAVVLILALQFMDPGGVDRDSDC
jgi:preprotein translocase subunit Sec61beta